MAPSTGTTFLDEHPPAAPPGNRRMGRRAVGTWLRTIHHLRIGQLTHQIMHRLAGPPWKPAEVSSAGCTGLGLARACPPLGPDGNVHDDGVSVRLVGQAPYDPLRAGWDDASRSALWRYTLQYHGWLADPALSPEAGLRTLLSWIDGHREGIGWAAYPTALRVFAWLGWLGLHGSELGAASQAPILASLSAQLEHLERHVEWHLGGNHVWTNLAALAAAGLALEGPSPRRLRDRFVPRFTGEVEAQLDADGMHREGCPSYHGLLAEQLDRVARLAAASGAPEASRLEAARARMLHVIPAFTHPDGDVALFCDSQRDRAANPARLFRDAGLALPTGSCTALAAGFARRAFGPFTVLFSAGRIGMPWQPGHVHADAGSFELSLYDDRVIVDAGFAGYEDTGTRPYVRSTAAHNTVTVGAGEPDQHELWASHRVGGRAEVEKALFDDSRLELRVRGFRSAASHERVIERTPDGFSIRDRVTPRAPATVRYHFAEDVSLEGEGLRLVGTTRSGHRFELTSSTPLVRTVVPGFRAVGVTAPRTCLAACLRDGAHEVRFTWREAKTPTEGPHRGTHAQGR